MSPDRGTRREMLAAVDRFAAERVAPRAAAIDESGELPRDLWNEAAALGLFALGVPEEYGGLGRDVITPLLISERLARASAAFSLSFNNTTDSVVPIIMEGAEALKRRYLPKVAKGEIIPCIAITEPTGGSDMAGIRTTAKREGGHYRLDGRKMWITNAPVGDVFTVFARTSEDRHKGLSAFVVERGTPGLSTGKAEPLIGLRGSPTGEVVFESVRVPVENRLGAEGDGFRIGALTLDESRLHCAAVSLGVATAALEQAVAYAKERVQFGKPIIEHQGLMFLLAELATELAAARALWEKSAELLLTDHSRRAASYAAMTKLLCSDLSMKITTEAVQVLGANGLSRAYPVERLMRDAKAFQIYDGTSQIQKWLIGRQLQKSGLPYGPLEPETGDG
jgi:alkylation response protein AidB-like acyl-CoA dehydrogenase